MAWIRFLLLYGDNGVVVGAGYTDVHVELPLLWALIGLASAAAIAAWANVWMRYTGCCELPWSRYWRPVRAAAGGADRVPTVLCQAE